MHTHYMWVDLSKNKQINNKRYTYIYIEIYIYTMFKISYCMYHWNSNSRIVDFLGLPRSKHLQTEGVCKTGLYSGHCVVIHIQPAKPNQ